MIELITPLLDGHLAIAAVVAVAAGILHGYTGFGGALLMVPLLSLLFGPIEAIVVTVLSGVFGLIPLVPGALKIVRWREIATMSLAIVIVTPLGAAALFVTDPATVRQIIGAIVLVVAVALAVGWVYRGPRGAVPGAVAGALCGAITGFAGMGGPPVALYFLSAPLPADIQRANIVIAIGVVAVMTVVSFAVGGGIGIETLLRVVALAPPYVAGSWAGARLFAHAPETLYKRVAIGLLIATGIAVLAL